MAAQAGARGYRAIVLGIVMLGTFMAILDASIVNVALPHMMSAFGVNREQIEWVATAFMLATAVAMPLVGWLVGRLGHKTVYLTALALFTMGSLVCGLAWSYNALIVSRIIQAIGGGAVQPVGMAIIADLYAPHERGKALGIWGTGVMVAPALGPTTGAYLTDWFNWRMIFMINLPFGLLTIILGLLVMRGDRGGPRRAVPLDWAGFALLSVALVGGLLALANGQDKGWTSDYVLTCVALTVAGLVLFVAVESSVAHPLLNLGLFRIPNFSIGMVLAVFRSVGLFGGMFLLPLFLENLAGYPIIDTGLWMMPGAVAVGVCMPIAGRLADRYSPRWLTMLGSLVTGVSLMMYGYLDPLSNATAIIGPQLIRGAGLALMMTPLLTAALNAVPPDMVATASSFLNVSQRLGGSFGIAVLNAYVTNAIHRHALRLGELVAPQSERLQRATRQGAGMVLRDVNGLVPSPQLKGYLLSASSISRRASVLGFANGFVLGGLVVLAGIPLCLLLTASAHHGRGGQAPGPLPAGAPRPNGTRAAAPGGPGAAVGSAGGVRVPSPTPR